MIFILLGAVFLFLKVYGEYTNLANIVCIKEGEIISGMEAVTYNQKIAMSYKGKITDDLLKQVHRDYMKAPHAENAGFDVCNTTYDYFEAYFNISKEDYLKVKEAYPNYKGDLFYGFSDNWRALWSSLCDFLNLVPLFIVIMAASIFSYERECEMAEILSVAKYGGNSLAKYKIQAVFIVMNFVLIFDLLLMFVIHFVKYGMEGYDTSIQCSSISYFPVSGLVCSYGQLVFHTVFIGILACNVILVIVIAISMRVRKSWVSIGASLGTIYVFSYSVLHRLFQNSLLDLIFALFPVNVLEISTVVNLQSIWGKSPSIFWFVILEMYYIVILVLGLMGICREWKKRQFYIVS